MSWRFLALPERHGKLRRINGTGAAQVPVFVQALARTQRAPQQQQHLPGSPADTFRAPAATLSRGAKVRASIRISLESLMSPASLLESLTDPSSFLSPRDSLARRFRKRDGDQDKTSDQLSVILL